MTPKEQLIQEVLQAPDFLVSALLKLLRLVSAGQMGIAHKLTQLVDDMEQPDASDEADLAPRLIYKGSALVVDGGLSETWDVNQLISDVREERIQEQIGL